MRQIMVLNSKGGCGKSTLATNLASWYAGQDKKVALVDYDPQGSSMEWLSRRTEDRPAIAGVPAWEDGLKHLPRSADVAIFDAPARTHGRELTDLLRTVETVIVPVLPSTIDIEASARFLEELGGVPRVQRKEVKVGVVANRVREYTLIFDELNEYLDTLRLPYLASLREAQNYIRAYSRGLGIFELPEYLAWPDWEQWQPLLDWLNSRRSRS
ncbi:MAG: ParA family protein [Chromatiales bacterium]|nr:ParA family protein [Chromatiales bacterium]